jgi:hypothetical protein
MSISQKTAWIQLVVSSLALVACAVLMLVQALASVIIYARGVPRG